MNPTTFAFNKCPCCKIKFMSGRKLDGKIVSKKCEECGLLINDGGTFYALCQKRLGDYRVEWKQNEHNGIPFCEIYVSTDAVRNDKHFTNFKYMKLTAKFDKLLPFDITEEKIAKLLMLA